jgi:4-amino-4-deoxy-L-arabinose transferase-like glycosyltransferase
MSSAPSSYHNWLASPWNRLRARIGRGLAAATRRGDWLRLALLALMLLTFALRVANLGDQELRGDETFGWLFIQRPLAELTPATVALKEPHPIGSYIVEQSWVALAGDSEFALRFVSAWWSVLAVALLYRLARRLGMAPIAATMGAGWLALSPYAVWHAQDARMYGQLLALTVAAVWLALEAMLRQRWPWIAAYIAVAYAALHTHYFAFFVLVALTVFWVGRAIFVPAARVSLANWLNWNVGLALIYSPWLATAGGVIGGYGGNGDSPTAIAAAQRALSVFAVGESVPPDQRLLWAGLATVMALTGLLWLVRDGGGGRRTAWLLLCYAVVPVAAAWYSAQERPIFNERYLIAAAPPFYLLMGAAWLPLRRAAPWLRWAAKALALVTTLLLVTGMLLSLDRHYNDPAFSKNRGWRTLATAIGQWAATEAPAQVRVAQNFPDPTLWYYYRESAPGAVPHLVLPPAAHAGEEAVAAVNDLVAGGVKRVILPLQPSPNWDDGNLAATALSAFYTRVHEETVGVWPVQVYAGRPGLDAERSFAVHFGGDLQLTGLSDLPARAAPGSLLTPTLFWNRDPDDPASAEVKVTLQLLAPDGTLVAQQDRPLAAARRGNGIGHIDTYGILIPAGVPAGRYRLVTALYDPAQPGAPRLVTDEGADVVLLGEIEVE